MLDQNQPTSSPPPPKPNGRFSLRLLGATICLCGLIVLGTILQLFSSTPPASLDSASIEFTNAGRILLNGATDSSKITRSFFHDLYLTEGSCEISYNNDIPLAFVDLSLNKGRSLTGTAELMVRKIGAFSLLEVSTSPLPLHLTPPSHVTGRRFDRTLG